MPDGLPEHLQRLWRLSEPGPLGRPAELSVDRVVAAAVAQADAGGLEAVTLPKLAARLQVTPMSLYRYVGSKDELLDLIRDAGLGTPPALDDATEWRAGLRKWAQAQYELFERRPWLPRVPIHGPPLGPNQLAWTEIGLQILATTGLNDASRLGILLLISGHVRQASLLSQELAGAREQERSADQRNPLLELVSPKLFPQLSQLFGRSTFGDAGASPAAEAGSEFEFGLECILDGVDVAIKDAQQDRPFAANLS